MPEVWTVEQFADWLKISKRSAAALLSQKVRAKQRHPVPFISVNGHKRIVRTEAELWLERLKKEAA